VTPTYPNRIADERAARGIGSPGALAALAAIEPDWYEHIEGGDILPTLDEFDRIRAALGGIEPERLYVFGLARTIGPVSKKVERAEHAAFWNDLSDSSHLLVSREEMSWLDRNVKPDRDVDVFVNLSCGAQHTPHVLLDAVAALGALGVRFAAGAGTLFCCGTNYRADGEMTAAERMRAASVGRTVAWGATTAVHMCTQCVNTFGEVERRERLLGETPPENMQMHTFIERTLRALGDAVPWKREVPARVLILRQDVSPVHSAASDTVARWLALVPGVEVVGFVDQELQAVSGAGNAFVIMQGPTPSRDEILGKRVQLADLFAARGADTMAAMHHTGQQWWSRFASDRLAVRHPISILADALGVANPDRYQAAARLGDPEAVLEQTRPIWRSWGMREDRARSLVAKIFAPALADGLHCACGGTGGCRGEELIDIDVISGKPLARRRS
jgi:hypothetical protein